MANDGKELRYAPRARFDTSTEEGRRWQELFDAFSLFLDENGVGRQITNVKTVGRIRANISEGSLNIVLPPPLEEEGDCLTLVATLTGNQQDGYKVLVTDGLIWANVGDRDASYDGIPTINSVPIDNDPAPELDVSSTGKLWIKISIDDNVALNKITASAFEYHTTTPTEVEPTETTGGTLYHPWASVTFDNEGNASLIATQCGSKQWQYCGGSVGRLTPYD